MSSQSSYAVQVMMSGNMHRMANLAKPDSFILQPKVFDVHILNDIENLQKNFYIPKN
jgi:hypothetical protein